MAHKRRDFLKLAAAGAGAATLGACAGGAGLFGGRKARVVVVGGGFGGATAAKYIRMWDSGIEVTVIERNPNFVSCPFSNLVIGGSKNIAELTHGYDALRNKYGVNVLQAEVIGVDPQKQTVTTSAGALGYDRLIVSPGIDFMYAGGLSVLASAAAQEQVPHAWKAGPQTLVLRRQLEAMPDGGVYAISIPKAPYRCPPGPYERICQVASYLKANKPKSKIIVLDANPEITSKKGLFTKVWAEMYPGMIEYKPNNPAEEVDVATRTIRTEFERLKVDVLNVVPPQKAGGVANLAGVVNVDNRWCSVDFTTYESKAQKNIHVIGDAIAAPLPKSGHMANQTGKVCAGAIVALVNGEAVTPIPVFANTCYSFVSAKEAMHVAGVYRYDPEKKAMAGIGESTGVSGTWSEIEGQYAQAWANNIWSDALK
jgi:NADPH-dependent 2,4-dienoyl-CoA reductase/sulfur reductase-like enzyme